MTKTADMEHTPLTLRNLAFVIGGLLIPITFFAVTSLRALDSIRLELTLLRNDVSHLENGSLETGDFDAWVDLLKAQNPDLVVPDARTLRQH